VLGYGEYRRPCADGSRDVLVLAGDGGDGDAGGYACGCWCCGGRPYGRWSCTGEPGCCCCCCSWGTDGRRGWYVNGESTAPGAKDALLAAGTCVSGVATVQSCCVSRAWTEAYVRRARRLPEPGLTTWPYPGWSGERHVLGNVGLWACGSQVSSVMHIEQTGGGETYPKRGMSSWRMGQATLCESERTVDGARSCKLLPAGETQGDLVGHPGALDLEVPAADAPQLRREVGLGLDHLHDVGCTGR
jgi:hypothetical protein